MDSGHPDRKYFSSGIMKNRIKIPTANLEYFGLQNGVYPVISSCPLLSQSFDSSLLPRDASAERGDEIACRLSVRLSVCNV